eukprot:CAMPEP_0172153718 /NCGR_PEP_ID=MMETSP1050-20130122/1617_1 /TAXON_ID=233186 /ORGANISM="Cryptomonas curvata, Strain CCAP979/52" /LENGTH=339 /DNA_ID=CAMNT_0012822319 /DNA_START=94 /DNA_END=1113 /DNA_ORIENTATION=+
MPDSMDNVSACNQTSTSTQPKATKIKSESSGGQVKMLMKAIDTEINLAKTEFLDDSELVFKGKAMIQCSQPAEQQYVVHAPTFVSHQDGGFESTIAQNSACKECNEAVNPHAVKVDDHSVSVLLSNSQHNEKERGMDSFLKGRVEHEQHRLEIQQRAKNLLRVADDKVPSSGGRWKGSLEMEEEENEETSLLNAGQPDQPWSGCEECGDILADFNRRSREADESSRPRSPAPANDETVEQTGGLAALKETVAAKLSLFRRDLLPLKLPMGNAGDDSPGRGIISQPARVGQRDDIVSVSTSSEVSDRAASHTEVGGKTGFALLRNSLAILREDLGLGSRP